MSDAARRPPGALEADVLATLWQADGPLTPGEVREQLGTDLAYTTVMTILTRLLDKGVVERERYGRAYRYTPALDAAELAASRMRAALDAGLDREAVLARFVGSLTEADEQTLNSLLRSGGD